MSTFDWIIGALLLLGAYKGFRDGFLMSLVMLLAIVVGIMAGFKLMDLMMTYLAGKFNIDTTVLPYIAFAAVFLLVVFSIYFLGKAIHASIDKTFLGRVDQVAGALLGAVRMLFMASIILWLSSSFRISWPESWTNNSRIYALTKSFAPTLSSYLGDWLPSLGDIFSKNLPGI